MKAFEYASPSTPEQAVQALAAKDNAQAIGGGTDLINRMKDYLASPDRVVAIKDVAGIKEIRAGSDGLTVGAGVSLSALADHAEVGKSYPAIRQAALDVATPQIRNMATLGGNLLQRPRCWYYRSGFGILGMKDGKSLVRQGDNRYHAIFLNDGDALFVQASSLAIPLVALGATATLQGGEGKRTVPVESLYKVPKTNEDYEVTTKADDVLLSVTIPPAKGKNATYEARWKQSHDWPLALCSVQLAMDGNTVSEARVILGSVAPVPYRSKEAEAALKGKALTPETAEAAGAAAVSAARPLSMNAYKIALTKTVVKRALLAAAGNRYWEA